MKNTKIQWADDSHNFWMGCRKVSQGCKNCYMDRIFEKQGKDSRVVSRTSDTTFYAPLEMTEPRVIFTCSMSDFFIEEADEWRNDAWEVIRQTPQHQWLILTKRPNRISECLPVDWGNGWDNVWLGVSIENMDYIERAYTLADIPAKIRFISAEPLLGMIDFAQHKDLLGKFHWCIIGGESGDTSNHGSPLYRESKLEWIGKIIADLRAASVKVFVKQMGTFLAKELGFVDQYFGGVMEEWDPKFQIREFPEFEGKADWEASKNIDEFIEYEIMENIKAENTSNKVSMNNNNQSKIIKLPFVKTAEELLDLEITEIPMLINPIFPQKGLACLSGSSDVGKSFLLLDLSIAISSESDEALGMRINRRNGNVLIVSTEDSDDELSVRLKQLAKEKKINAKKIDFIFETENILKKIDDQLSNKPADLVVLDTLGDIFSGNPNDSIRIRQFFKPYKFLAQKHNCLFVFNHHIGKGKESHNSPSKNDVLGSQAIEAASRTVLILRKMPDSTRVLTVVKGNYIPDELKNRGMVFKFDPNKGFSPTGATIMFSAGNGTGIEDEALRVKVVALYPQLGSYLKVAEQLRKEGYKVDKNKVGQILKKHSPSDPNPMENDDGQESVAA